MKRGRMRIRMGAISTVISASILACGARTSSEYREIPAGASPLSFVDLGLGSLHTCAMTNNGLVYCWGSNEMGQVSGRASNVVERPQQVRGLPIVRSLAVSADFNCAISLSDEVWCWGNGQFGNLGCSIQAGGPVRIERLQGIRQISCGRDTSCAVDSSHRVYCWGKNNFGRLISNDSTPQYCLPQVIDLPRSDLVQVAESMVCARGVDGTVRCWGFGADVVASRGHSSLPVSFIHEVSEVVGATRFQPDLSNVCAELIEGVVCWGESGNAGFQRFFSTMRLHLLRSSLELCGINRQHELVCWYGANSPLIRLLRGDDPPPSSPIEATIPLGFQLLEGEIGSAHACLISSTGQIWCWGRNDRGQLGSGAGVRSPRLIPVQL